MIFTPPRFVVVDDKPEHLDAILNVFQELGSPCLGVTYEPEKGLDKTNFEGVRVLFLDLHLIDHTPTTDDKPHFGLIAKLLEDNISATGGPFVLVVWTAYAQSVQQLKDYLDEPNSIDPAKPYARPLAVVGMPKDQFIVLDTGKPLVDKADALRKEVVANVEDIPQLAALLSWEVDVQAAAGETLATLVELVPENQRSANFADGLGGVLGRLADAAAGKHAAANPRAAVTSALAPILADRIVKQQGSEAASEAWGHAITGKGDTPLGADITGRVNRMLHVAVPRAETIKPIDWGAVVEFPEAWTGEEVKARFGVTRSELLVEEYKLKKGDGERCRWRLIRIGAACDYAQNRAGPLTYLLGLEIPADLQKRRRKNWPMSAWSSPTLATESQQEPFILAVNARYAVNVVQATAEAWQPIYRLREQLLMHLIAHAGSYLTRPGIVSL